MAEEAFCPSTVRLIRIVHIAGQNWVKRLQPTDWRAQLYKTGKPPVPLYSSEHAVVNTLKQGKPTSPPPECFVVPCDSLAEKEHEKAIVLMRLVPSVGAKGDQPRHVNFHVWWHARNRQSKDLVLGWRMEASEGEGTGHDFCHVQPIRGFAVPSPLETTAAWFPEKFPTIPLRADDQFELALASCISMCSAKSVEELLRKDRTLADHAGPYLRKVGF